MILCVNPNAGIDRLVIVPGFRLNTIQRPERVLALPGGKGCNVARALRRLGESPVVTGWIGGHAGRFIEEGLHTEGIATDFVYAEGESRTCVSILDPQGHTLTELYEPGLPVPGAQLEEFTRRFAASVRRYAAVTFSGSLPPGVPPDFYQRMIEIARAAGAFTVLDSSGEALRLGLQARPTLVKPNEHEFADLVGKRLDHPMAYAQTAMECAERYHTTVVVSLGAAGAIAAHERAVWRVCPPPVTVQSTVGSGDSMVAGLVHGLLRGFPLTDVLRWGVVAGAANTLTLGAGVLAVADVQRMLPRVKVTRVE